MAEFYVALSAVEMARQAADLLNKNNQLYTTHNAGTLQTSDAKYFTEIYGSKVVGCAALLKETSGLSKIFHICVDNAYRRKGIAKKLVCLAIDNCETDLIYMTIREDNIPSLTLAASLGFVFAEQKWSRDHWVYTVGRAKHAQSTKVF